MFNGTNFTALDAVIIALVLVAECWQGLIPVQEHDGAVLCNATVTKKPSHTLVATSQCLNELYVLPLMYSVRELIEIYEVLNVIMR